MYKFIKKIKDFALKQNIIIALTYIVEFLSVFIILFFVIFALRQIRSSLIFYINQALKLFGLGYLGYSAYRIRHNFINIQKAASILDKRNNDKAETLLNAYELKFEKKVNPLILKKIFEKAEEKITDTNLKADYQFFKKRFLIFIIILFAFLWMFAIMPSEVRDNFAYLLKITPPEKIHKKTVELLPGNKKILTNSNLTIQVINPEMDVEHIFYFKTDKIWRKEVMKDYIKTFDNLDFSFEYFIKTPYATSDTFKISVYELPVIKKIKITYFYPSYTRLKTYVDTSGTGNISAIKNTRIKLKIESNNPIKAADMFFSYGKHIAMDRIGNNSFQTEFKLQKSGWYHIDLVDILDNKSEKIQYSIDVIKDQEPEIEFLYPAKDTLLTKDMKTHLKIIASDDFGLQNLLLKYQINDGKINTIKIKSFIKSNLLNLDYVFDLNNLELYPGDNILYWSLISDNCPQTHTSSTAKFNLKFPSIQEIYQRIEKEEKEKQEKLKDVYKKAQKLQKQYDIERRKAIKKDKLDWEQKEKLKDILKRQKEMAKSVEKVAKEYEKLVQNMEKNKTSTKETMEKLKKIEELMKDISNEKLKKAMEEMQKKLENAKPEDLKKAMENLKISMEEFNKKLEQTIKLLEQIKKEQALEKSLEIAKEMEKLQENINKKTKENSSDKEKLSKMQDKVGEDLKDLKDQLQKTSEMFNDQKDQKLKEALKKLSEQLESDSLSEKISESKNQLMKNNMQKAMKSQKQAMSSIKSAKQKLQNMLSMFNSSGGMQMKIALDNTIMRLFILSSQISELKKDYRNDPTPVLDRLISNYNGLSLALKKLYKTPMIMLVLGPAFLDDSSQTITAFQKMFEEIANRRYYRIKTELNTIYAGYNKMIYDLLQSKKNMSQQGAMSSGMEAMMQALQQMGQQQMMMNMLTMQMMKQLMNGGKMSNELRQQAQRLAEEESRLAENLKRLMRTNSEAQKRSGTLKKIAEELQDVARKLKSNRIDRELIDKQKRILSRLLEAQKSIHKRGFSKKRKSEIDEKKYQGIKKSIGQKINELKIKSLLKENELDYPIEYRKLIDEYLKKLNEEF